jgi:hypothetical protein
MFILLNESLHFILISELYSCTVRNLLLTFCSCNFKFLLPFEHTLMTKILTQPKHVAALPLSDPTLDLVRQYDFPVPLRCRKTSDTVFVAFVRPLSEHVRRFSSCSTDFSQQIAQVVLFLFLYVFLF